MAKKRRPKQPVSGSVQVEEVAMSKKPKKPVMSAELRRETADLVREYVEDARLGVRTKAALCKLDQIVIDETGHDAVHVEGYFDMVEDDNDEGGWVLKTDDTMIKLYQELKLLCPLIEIIGGPGRPWR
jgi:uncharacterized protein YnzC (UPF0291/DUF896 family)